jgi:hypothetical protein|tara:strand:- start:319 stop:558 length:240 start_codon:yes stop_codon:yes gene_type:complete
VATGSDLQGGGVFGFIKAKGTPQNRAIIGSVFVALGVFFTNPQLVTVTPARIATALTPTTPTSPTLTPPSTPALPHPDP